MTDAMRARMATSRLAASPGAGRGQVELGRVHPDPGGRGAGAAPRTAEAHRSVPLEAPVLRVDLDARRLARLVGDLEGVRVGAPRGGVDVEADRGDAEGRPCGADLAGGEPEGGDEQGDGREGAESRHGLQDLQVD